VKQATLLCEVIMEFINDTECTNPMPIYKRLERERSQCALEETANSSIYNIRSRSSRVLEQSDREALSQSRGHNRSGKSAKKAAAAKHFGGGAASQARHSRRKVNETDSWVQECKALIEHVCGHPDGEVFLEPVNIEDWPDYYETIESPISFSQIREKLERNEYAELKDFDDDCKLLFQNSKTYNTQKRSKVCGSSVVAVALLGVLVWGWRPGYWHHTNLRS
jgi:hypothetical protein